MFEMRMHRSFDVWSTSSFIPALHLCIRRSGRPPSGSPPPPQKPRNPAHKQPHIRETRLPIPPQNPFVLKQNAHFSFKKIGFSKKLQIEQMLLYPTVQQLVVVRMETLEVKKSDFSRILSMAELLVHEVEHALSQDEIVRKRVKDIKSGRVKGKSEGDYYEYLKKRGIKAC